MSPGDSLDALDEFAVWFDLDRLVEWLLLDPSHSAHAVAWLRERDEMFAVHPYADSSRIDPGLGGRRLWFEACIWLAGGTPAAAARGLRQQYLDMTLSGVDGWTPARLLARGRGPIWVADLAGRIAGWPRSYALLAQPLTEFGLPVPVGAGFVQGWVGSLAGMDVPGMVVRLRAEPQVVSLVEQYLASDLVRPQPPVARALPALVAEGLLDRGWLLHLVVQRLTTPPRPSVQRELAGLLAAVDVALEDLPGGAAFAATLVATCHGSVGAVMLPLLLEVLTDPAELVELTTTLAARPEKAQRQTLLRALRRPGLRERVGAEAVREALGVLGSAGDDTKLVAQVAAALAALPGEPASAASAGEEPLHVAGWWALRPPGSAPVVRPLREAALLSRVQLRALCRALEQGGPSAHDVVDPARELELDVMVRAAAQVGAEKLAGWLRGLVRKHAERPHWIGEGMADWAADASWESYAAARRRVGHRELDPVTRHTVGPYALSTPATAMPYLRAREALLRLGDLACLLSTPTHDDHTLTLDALLARLRLHDGGVVGPLDLLQALLRLQPVDPSRDSEVAELDVRVHVGSPVDDKSAAGLPLDAVAVVRNWVSSGGLPGPQWRFEPQSGPHSSWAAEAQLPVPQGLLDCAPEGLFAFDRFYGGAAWAGVLPGWPDLRLGLLHAMAEPGFAPIDVRLQRVLFDSGRLDLPAYDQLLHVLVSTDRRHRVEAAQVVLELVGQDRFDPDRCTRVALMRLQAAVLPLARFSQVLEVGAGVGGLAALWPVVTAVAGAACGQDRTPAGTVDVLRVLADVAHEVPDPVLPAPVEAFARRGGRSRAAFEARRLLTVTTRAAAA